MFRSAVERRGLVKCLPIHDASALSRGEIDRLEAFVKKELGGKGLAWVRVGEDGAWQSPIAKFLERNPDGGIHHLCYEVDDIISARDELAGAGARVLGDGSPKIGAHGKPVLFLHPKDFCGTLVELEQA